MLLNAARFDDFGQHESLGTFQSVFGVFRLWDLLFSPKKLLCQSFTIDISLITTHAVGMNRGASRANDFFLFSSVNLNIFTLLLCPFTFSVSRECLALISKDFYSLTFLESDSKIRLFRSLSVRMRLSLRSESFFDFMQITFFGMIPPYISLCYFFCPALYCMKSLTKSVIYLNTSKPVNAINWIC